MTHNTQDIAHRDYTSLQQATLLLRKNLGQWAQRPSVSFILRPCGTDRHILRNVQHSLALLRSLRPHAWHVGLKHAMPETCTHKPAPLLLWSENLEQEQQRMACHGIETFLRHAPHYSPVLVTDRADFAFYARLQWLVEYLPPIHEYKETKRAYLAWRYRTATALPLCAGLATTSDIVRILAHS